MRKDDAVQVEGVDQCLLFNGRLEVSRDMYVVCERRTRERRGMIIDVAASTDAQTEGDDHGRCETGLAEELEVV